MKIMLKHISPGLCQNSIHMCVDIPKYSLTIQFYRQPTFRTTLEMCIIICTNEKRGSKLVVLLLISSPIKAISVVFLKSLVIL